MLSKINWDALGITASLPAPYTVRSSASIDQFTGFWGKHY
jgi:hypothetical protein